jgi:hypothetical protein
MIRSLGTIDAQDPTTPVMPGALGAVESYAMEGDLLALRDGTRDGASELAIEAQSDRVAAQWPKIPGEAIAQFCHRACETGKLSG